MSSSIRIRIQPTKINADLDPKVVDSPPEKTVKGDVDEESAEPLVGDQVKGNALRESALAPHYVPSMSAIFTSLIKSRVLIIFYS